MERGGGRCRGAWSRAPDPASHLFDRKRLQGPFRCPRRRVRRHKVRRNRREHPPVPCPHPIMASPLLRLLLFSDDAGVYLGGFRVSRQAVEGLVIESAGNRRPKVWASAGCMPAGKTGLGLRRDALVLALIARPARRIRCPRRGEAFARAGPGVSRARNPRP